MLEHLAGARLGHAGYTAERGVPLGQIRAEDRLDDPGERQRPILGQVRAEDHAPEKRPFVREGHHLVAEPVEAVAARGSDIGVVS